MTKEQIAKFIGHEVNLRCERKLGQYLVGHRYLYFPKEGEYKFKQELADRIHKMLFGDYEFVLNWIGGRITVVAPDLPTAERKAKVILGLGGSGDPGFKLVSAKEKQGYIEVEDK